MECVDVRRELSAYIDGEVSDEIRDEIRSHIEGCAECRRAKDDMASAWGALDLIGDVEPSGLRERVWQRIREEEGLKRRSVKRRWWLALPAAAMLLLTLSILYLYGPTVLPPEKESLKMEAEAPDRVGRPPSVSKYRALKRKDAPRGAVDEEGVIAAMHMIEGKDFLEKVELLRNMEYLLFVMSEERG